MKPCANVIIFLLLSISVFSFATVAHIEVQKPAEINLAGVQAIIFGKIKSLKSYDEDFDKTEYEYDPDTLEESQVTGPWVRRTAELTFSYKVLSVEHEHELAYKSFTKSISVEQKRMDPTACNLSVFFSKKNKFHVFFTIFKRLMVTIKCQYKKYLNINN